jgi:hypothetical protein
MKHGLIALFILVGIGAAAAFLRFGTIEPCGIVRWIARDALAREGKELGGVISSLAPDSIIDATIATQYGPLSPGSCVKILVAEWGAPKPLPPRDKPAGSIAIAPSRLPPPLNPATVVAVPARNQAATATSRFPSPPGPPLAVDWKEGKLSRLTKYIGTYRYDEVLTDPDVDASLDSLMDAQSKALLRENLGTRSPVGFAGMIMILRGIKAHAGGSEEAVMTIRPNDGDVQAAIQHNGKVYVYTQFTSEPENPSDQ